MAIVALSGADAAVFQLKNGDRISGDLSAHQKAGSVTVTTGFGELTIPKSALESAVNSDGSAVLDIPLPSEMVVDAAEGQVDSAPTPAEAESEPAPLPEEPKDPQWVQDYRSFVKSFFPENWQFRVRGGIEYRETSSSSTSYEFAADAKRVWDDAEFDATIYYNYATETIDNLTGRTADKYGINTSYKQVFDQSLNWYLQNLAGYKVDWVKGIRDQFDEAVTVGYRFEWEEHDVVLDIAPGPAVRYVNAYNYDQHWVAMGVLTEELTWKINQLLRFEQKLYLGINVTNYHKYSANFNLGLIIRATDVMDIALRYSYEYDSINDSEAQKSEQRLLLAFEFPFNWKY